MTEINTVAGTIKPEDLGRTLMHEHVFVQYGKPSPETMRPGPKFDEILRACSGYVDQLKNYGVSSVVDPTTVDLGRNVPLLSALSEKTGLNIICCTGIYSTGTYLNLCELIGGGWERIADLFIRELTEGIDDTGIKAGIIKVVTGYPEVGALEREILLAAAKASVDTGAPIITHTEGVLGDEQQEILGGAGVPLHRIIVGHSCISTSFNYHRQIIRDGSYIGFDRFGMEGGMPDEVRAASIVKLINAGYVSRIIVSHDSVWYWVGGPNPCATQYENWKPTNFFERVIPILTYEGVDEAVVEMMLTENPRRFFAQEVPEVIESFNVKDQSPNEK